MTHSSQSWRTPWKDLSYVCVTTSSKLNCVKLRLNYFYLCLLGPPSDQRTFSSSCNGKKIREISRAGDDSCIEECKNEPNCNCVNFSKSDDKICWLWQSTGLNKQDKNHDAIFGSHKKRSV